MDRGRLKGFGFILTSALFASAAVGQPRGATSVGVAGPAAEFILERAADVRSAFWVFLNSGSGENHGTPSGFFGPALQKITLNAACLHDETGPGGCATNTSRIDREHGTVMCYSFQPMTGNEFAGVSIVEPDGLFSGTTGAGYDLRGAGRLVFDAISATANLRVQFGFGGAAAAFRSVPSSWTRISVDAASLSPSPNLAQTSILFTIVTNAANASEGGRVCVDNIRFEPQPTPRASALGFPRSFETLGVVPAASDLAGRVPVPPDQLLAGQSLVESSARAAEALLRRGTPNDLQGARIILDSLAYALDNPNAALPLPISSNSRGLPYCLSSGDVALNNPSGAAQKGNARPCGFSAGSDFRVVLDGAGTGSNAAVGLAFLRGYLVLREARYLAAATTIGNWIHDNLRDEAAGFGGYFTGFQNGLTGGARIKILAKQFADNAVVFSFYSLLAATSRNSGNAEAGAEWDRRAANAGDFSLAMVSSDGQVASGTVPRTQPTDLNIGVKADGQVSGNDIVNTFTAARNYALALLTLASSARYRDQRDWRRTAQGLLQQSKRINAAGRAWEGIHPSAGLPSNPDGIGWEATATTVLALQVAGSRYPDSAFRERGEALLNQLRQAQTTLGGGRGVPSATLEGEESLPPYQHCLSTAYDCLPSRVSLSATALALAADLGFNLYAPSPIVADGGIVNAASSSAAAFSGNTIITIYGHLLSSQLRSAELVEGRLPVVVDGTAVIVDGVCVPIFFVSPGQINAILPADMPSSGTLNLVVATGIVYGDCQTGRLSTVATTPVARVSPGLFTLQAGQGPIAALRGEDNVVITSETPARSGGVLVAFGTGCGPISPQVATGVPVEGLVRLTLPVEAMIGDQMVSGSGILFAGLTPGAAGLCQFNLRLPTGLTGRQSIRVIIGGASTQTGPTVEIQ